jgi:hypothetical protein
MSKRPRIRQPIVKNEKNGQAAPLRADLPIQALGTE